MYISLRVPLQYLLWCCFVVRIINGRSSLSCDVFVGRRPLRYFIRGSAVAVAFFTIERVDEDELTHEPCVGEDSM